MAITPGQIQFRNGDGIVLANGRLNNLFSNAYTTSGTAYAWVEVWLTSADLTLTSPRAWLSIDPRGGTIAIGYDSTSGVIPHAADFQPTAVSSLTFSSPTTKSSGLVLGTMDPGTKLRIGVRRQMTSATAASPEANRLWVGGTSPA